MKKKATSIAIFVVGVVITLSAVTNVLTDNAEVMGQAERVVCEGKGPKCPYAKTGMMRTPLGQTFTFAGGGKNIEVTCRRAVIALGEYTCKPDPQP